MNRLKDIDTHLSTQNFNTTGKSGKAGRQMPLDVSPAELEGMRRRESLIGKPGACSSES